jgi:hypothetical protein
LQVFPSDIIAGRNPFPSQYPPPATAAFLAGNIATQVYPPNLRRTYIHQYNASYQNQIKNELKRKGLSARTKHTNMQIFAIRNLLR